MRKPRLLALAVAATLAGATLFSAFAEEPKMSAGITTEPGKGKAVSIVKATATVESINPATREVVLKTPKGETHTVVAGEEVHNFDQIKVGDKVHARYMEALTVELKKDGKDVVGRRESSSMNRAAPGQKPGGIASREVTVVADVVDVDHKNKLVKVKNEQGEVVDLHLNDPEQVKLVKKGDQIQATYTEAFAVALEPVAPAKKK